MQQALNFCVLIKVFPVSRDVDLNKKWDVGIFFRPQQAKLNNKIFNKNIIKSEYSWVQHYSGQDSKHGLHSFPPPPLPNDTREKISVNGKMYTQELPFFNNTCMFK